MEQFASGGDVTLAVGVGEQTVVADAMKARGQHVQQEATHELVRLQGHGFVARTSVFAVVLPTEGDAASIQGQKPRVGDRHAMGVTRQIGENLLRTCERALRIDDPLTLTEGAKPVRERIGVGQIDVLAKELELASTM